MRATFSTESPSRRRFFATSFFAFLAAPYSQYDLSISFIILLSIYLELKLHNFTSFCNTLNTESEEEAGMKNPLDLGVQGLVKGGAVTVFRGP